MAGYLAFLIVLFVNERRGESWEGQAGWGGQGKVGSFRRITPHWLLLDFSPACQPLQCALYVLCES